MRIAEITEHTIKPVKPKPPLSPAQARIAIAGVGSTILAPILAVLPTTVPVPISRLGHIEKDK